MSETSTPTETTPLLIAPLQWSDALFLNDAKTDLTHQEFIDLYQQTGAAMVKACGMRRIYLPAGLMLSSPIKAAVKQPVVVSY
jgi:hypothetical protein